MSIITIIALVLVLLSIPLVTVAVWFTIRRRRFKTTDLEAQVDASVTGQRLSPKSAVLDLTSQTFDDPSLGSSVVQPESFVAIVHPVPPSPSLESSVVLREQLASLFGGPDSFGHFDVEPIEGTTWFDQEYAVSTELLREFQSQHIPCCEDPSDVCTPESQSVLIEFVDTLFDGVPFSSEEDVADDEPDIDSEWTGQPYDFPTDLKDLSAKHLPCIEQVVDNLQPHSATVELLNTPENRLLLEAFPYDYIQYKVKLHASDDPTIYITPPAEPEPSPTLPDTNLHPKRQRLSSLSPQPLRSINVSAPLASPRKHLTDGLPTPPRPAKKPSSRLGAPKVEESTSASQDAKVKPSTSSTLARPSPLRKVCDFSKPDQTKVSGLVDRFNRVSSGQRSHKSKGKSGSRVRSSRIKLPPKEIVRQQRFSGGYRSALLKTTPPPPLPAKAKGKAREKENIRPQWR